MGRFALVESDKGLGDWISASLALTRVDRDRQDTLDTAARLGTFERRSFRRGDRYLLTVTGTVSMDAEDPIGHTSLLGAPFMSGRCLRGKR